MGPFGVPGQGRLVQAGPPEPAFPTGTRAARGENVGLRLDPAGCHVFAAPGTGASHTDEPPENIGETMARKA